MEPETLSTFDKIIQYANTPWGKVVIQGLSVFAFCEFFVRIPMLEYLRAFTKLPKIKRKFIGDYAGIVSTFIIGILAAVVIHWGDSVQRILYLSWYLIILSMVFHVIYIKYLDEWVRKKLGIDK